MGDRKRIVVKREGAMVEDFLARAVDFEVDPAYVVTGRRVQVPVAIPGDRLYVDGRVGGEIVAVVPAKLDQCWNMHFSPTEAFLRRLRKRRGRQVANDDSEVGETEAEAGAGAGVEVEADELPFPVSIEKPMGEAVDLGAGAVQEMEADDDGDH